MIAITAPCWTLKLLNNKLNVILAPDDTPRASKRVIKCWIFRMLFW